MSHRLLLVGSDTPAMERLLPILERAEFHVVRAVGGAALAAAAAERFDLVVARYPVTGVTLAELVSVLQAHQRGAGVLLLADPAHASEVAHFLGQGVTRIVSPNAPTQRLFDVLGGMLEVVPRRALRASVQLEARLSGEGQSVQVLTRNLSATGMLAEGGRELPVGARVAFAMWLPEEDRAIEGQAEVVRQVDVEHEGVAGIALRFTSFVTDGQTRLLDILEWTEP